MTTTTTKKPNPKKIKWNPAWADIVIELGKSGASLKTMYAAIGISARTALQLRKEDADAEEAFNMARTYSQAFWETLLLTNIDNKTFNSRVAEIALRGLFPEDYKETRDTKVDVKAEVKVDFGKEVQELISALKSSS